jgi:hypothetical protein
MEKNKQNAFMFYLSWSKQIEMLTAEETKSFIQNLIRYHKGEEIQMTGLTKNMFVDIKPQLDANITKYQMKIEKIKRK